MPSRTFLAGLVKSEPKFHRRAKCRAFTTIFGNGARAPGIGKISGVSGKIGKIVYRQTNKDKQYKEADNIMIIASKLIFIVVIMSVE